MAGRLSIRGLRKEFEGGDVVAVDGLDLEVEDGEFVVFVGPSGCGKSTTLRCIAGLETPTAGEIRLNGEVIDGKPPRERDLAMVFQDYALYPHMTARENMGFALKMGTDLGGAEVQRRVEEVAEMMGITEYLDQSPGDLSGGQQQRVALGRAIVQEPAAFLMDEPLSNLDANLRQRMRTELKRLQQDLAVTTVYVTHNQDEAMTMADRIAVLNDGRLQQVGTPLECYRAPANTFVASFLGSPGMNFLEVSYDPAAGTLRSPALEYPASDRMTAALGSEPAELLLGVRPKVLEVVGDSGDADLTAETVVVEPHGAVTHVAADHGAGELTVTVPGTHRRTGADGFAVGADLHVAIPESGVCLFDRESGESVVTMTEDREPDSLVST